MCGLMADIDDYTKNYNATCYFSFENIQINKIIKYNNLLLYEDKFS